MFLDKKNNLVNNCPDCKVKFVTNKGAACSASCPTKKLAIKHQKIIVKTLSYCLPKQKIKVECLLNLSTKTLLSDGWGWTDDIKGVIYIPWYTLRSKTEFLDTIAHEAGHIKAYQKKFTLGERSILKKLALLYEKKEQVKDSQSAIWLSRELNAYRQKNQKLIEKYLSWEGHDYNPWHQEYLKLFQKLMASPFAQYAYGNHKPRSHGFDKQGRGKYVPKIKLALK